MRFPPEAWEGTSQVSVGQSSPGNGGTYQKGWKDPQELKKQRLPWAQTAGHGPRGGWEKGRQKAPQGSVGPEGESTPCAAPDQRSQSGGCSREGCKRTEVQASQGLVGSTWAPSRPALACHTGSRRRPSGRARSVDALDTAGGGPLRESGAAQEADGERRRDSGREVRTVAQPPSESHWQGFALPPSP